MSARYRLLTFNLKRRSAEVDSQECNPFRAFHDVKMCSQTDDVVTYLGDSKRPDITGIRGLRYGKLTVALKLRPVRITLSEK